MELTEPEIQLINLYRELDTHGYGELLCKWRDNKVVKLAGTKEFKPVAECNRLTLIVNRRIIETIE